MIRLNAPRRMFFVLGVALVATSVRAEVPDTLEPDYSTAVLNYNSHQYQKALAALDSLITRDPKVYEFLELKALTLKAADRDSDAQKVYGQLIVTRKKAGAKSADLAPYHFELAMILQRSNKTALAKQYFAFALKNGFNVAVCHMYLGMADFQDVKLADAEGHFKGVIASDIVDLKPAAQFYLGQVYLKMGSASMGTRAFLEAETLAKERIDSPSSDPDSQKVSKQIYEATQQALAPYQHGSFFGSASILQGYDTNVATIPSSVTDPTQVSGKGTMKTTFLGGLGYQSSSLKKVQFVPSYKGSFNYNYNSSSKGYEYFSNIVSLYTTVDPLERLSYGLKVEGDLTFQNIVDSTTNQGTFHPYSRALSIGPYARFQLRPQWQLGAEFFVAPTSYTQDPATGSTRQSGTALTTRVFATNERGTRFLNPGGGIRFSTTDSTGSEYFANTYTFDVSNQMHVDPKWDVAEYVSYALVSYPKRPEGARNDDTLTIQSIGTYKWIPHWSFLGNLTYTNNSSNFPDLYQYVRFEISVGASYSF